MDAANTESHNASGQVPYDGNAREQADEPRNTKLLLRLEGRGNHSLLSE